MGEIFELGKKYKKLYAWKNIFCVWGLTPLRDSITELVEVTRVRGMLINFERVAGRGEGLISIPEMFWVFRWK